MDAGGSGRKTTEPASDPLLDAIGERIARAREAAGLSLVEAARAAGFTKAYQWRIEQGDQNLSVRTLARVALALSTTMSDLLVGVAADPGAIIPRPYTWSTGSDPREKRPGGGWLPAKDKAHPTGSEARVDTPNESDAAQPLPRRRSRGDRADD